MHLSMEATAHMVDHLVSTFVAASFLLDFPANACSSLHARFDVCDGSRLAAAFLQHSGARASTADERRPAKHAESTAAAAISLQAAAPVADALASSHAADTAARGHAAADKGNAVVRSGAAAAVPGHAGDAQEQACTGKPAQRGAGEGMGASAAAGSASSDSVDTLAGVPDSARV